jgi:hypothetical protein
MCPKLKETLDQRRQACTLGSGRSLVHLSGWCDPYQRGGLRKQQVIKSEWDFRRMFRGADDSWLLCSLLTYVESSEADPGTRI